jgi:AcrR family transcriptional regulator
LPSKAEQTERTRAALIAAGRALFTERGFADTATEELVRTAGVTRGALYHHFADKKALFEAVYEDVETTLVAKLLDRLNGLSEPIDILRTGVEAFLDCCMDPSVRRIALVEAPSVLGWERWREIDMAYGLGLVQMSLKEAMDAGALERSPVEPLASVLFGGLMEAGMLLAASPNPSRTRKELGAALRRLIDGLAASHA